VPEGVSEMYYDIRDPEEIIEDIIKAFNSKLIFINEMMNEFAIEVNFANLLDNVKVTALRSVFNLRQLQIHYPILRNFIISTYIDECGMIINGAKN
jgi:hypothetical protein